MLKNNFLPEQKTKSFFYKKTAKIILLVFIIGAVFLLAQTAGAQLGQVPTLGEGAEANLNLATGNLEDIVVNLINYALGFLGLIAIVIFIYGGFVYMFSGGDPDKVNKAKKIIINGVIGLVIVLLAFVIANFVFSLFNRGIWGNGVRPLSEPPSPYIDSFALGNGIVESVYPQHRSVNVPRNTNILVTFKEAMNPATIIDDTNDNDIYGDCTSANFEDCDKIADSVIIEFENTGGDFVDVSSVLARMTEDKKTFIFKPVNFLGNPTTSSLHRITLTQDIKKANDEPAFFGRNFIWSFTVSNKLDLTPPQITKIIPLPASTGVDRNTIIHIEFNEPINPLTLGGRVEVNGPVTGSLLADSFDTINICTDADSANCNNTSSQIIAGEFRYANQYKTVEFITSDPCGINSCGQVIYCLPSASPIDVLVKAASVVDLNIGEEVIKIAFFDNGYDGLVDMADNSLDGNKNDQVEGPVADNVLWQITTNDQIDLVPPEITTYGPGQGGQVHPATNPEVFFSKPMSHVTLSKTGNNYNNELEYMILEQPVNYLQGYAIECVSIDSAGDEIALDDDTTLVAGTKAIIIHPNKNNPNPFKELSDDYAVIVGSGITDLKQNCYLPCSDQLPLCQRGAAVPGTPGQYLPSSTWQGGTQPSCDLTQ